MRFIWVYALVHFLSLVDASSDGLHFYIALVNVTLLMVGRKGGFNCHKFYTRLLAQLAYTHWVVFVLQGISQHLVYFRALASKPCPIQTASWGIYSILEGSFDGSVYPTFSEGIPKWSGGLAIVSTRDGLPDPPILSAISALFYRLMFSWSLFSGGSWGVLYLVSLCSRGSKIL